MEEKSTYFGWVFIIGLLVSGLLILSGSAVGNHPPHNETVDVCPCTPNTAIINADQTILAVSVAKSSPSVPAGETIQLTYTIKNVGSGILGKDDSTTVSLSFTEGLPEGWEVAQHRDAEGEWTGPGAWLSSMGWDWDFSDRFVVGDDRLLRPGETITPTLTLRAPTDAAGTYSVTATLFYPNGEDEARVEIPIRPPNKPPTATIDINSSHLLVGQPVRLDASQSDDPNVQGTIKRYAWDFDGDEQPESTDASLVHTFDEPGTYNVTLTVTDNRNATGTDTKTIRISPNEPPTPRLHYTTPISSAHPAVLRANASTDPNGPIAAYLWDLNNDSIVDARGRQIHHRFGVPGTYTVNLSVVDEQGLRNSTRQTIRVFTPPKVRFTYIPRYPAVGDIISFTAAESTAPNSSITDYTWDLDGDGTPDAHGEQVRYSYADPGNYTVTLALTAENGVTVTRNTTVRIRSAVGTNSENTVNRPQQANASGGHPLDVRSKHLQLQLKGHNVDPKPGESAKLEFSAINTLTSEDPVTIQLILSAPSGLSATGAEFAKSGGGGLYTTNVTLVPGDQTSFNIFVAPSQYGGFYVEGYAYYYFGEDTANATVRTLRIPVITSSTQTTPANRDTDGSIFITLPDGYQLQVDILSLAIGVGIALVVGLVITVLNSR